MAILFDDASLQFLQKDSIDIADLTNFSMSIWFNSNDITSQISSMISIVDKSVSDEYYTLRLRDDKVEFGARKNGNAEVTVATSTTFTANGWHNAIATYNLVSPTNGMKVYLDGGGSNSADSPSVQNLDRTSIGVLGNLAFDQEHMSGMLACAAVWNHNGTTVLGSREIALIANGAHPFSIELNRNITEPDSLVSFIPMYVPNTRDLVSSTQMTAFNSPTVGHPEPPLGCPPLDDLVYKVRGIDKKVVTRVI